MEVVAPFSFDKDIIHDKMEQTNAIKFGISGGDFLQEEETAVTGREDREKVTKTAGAARTMWKVKYMD